MDSKLIIAAKYFEIILLLPYPEVVHGQEFIMEFYDEDDRSDDEFLGRATVRTAAVADRGEISGFWVDLEEVKTGKAQVVCSRCLQLKTSTIFTYPHIN